MHARPELEGRGTGEKQSGGSRIGGNDARGGDSAHALLPSIDCLQSYPERLLLQPQWWKFRLGPFENGGHLRKCRHGQSQPCVLPRLVASRPAAASGVTSLAVSA